MNKSKEELIAIILRKDDVERRLQNVIKELLWIKNNPQCSAE